MIPVLYPSTETAFENNGLGGLPDAISCVVTEQRNTQGGYYLEMEYPVDGLHYDLLAPERIIYAAPSMGNTPQPFRISRITRPINGIVHIEAPHLCAELQKLTSWGVDTGTNIQGMIYNQFYRARQLGQTVPFWCETDITVESDVTFSHPEPTSLADILLGSEGSVLDVVGGEYEWDGYHIILHRQRGVDSGLEIRYGVNMSDLEAETDATELVTACVPFWKGTVNDVETVVIGDMCSASNASAYAYVRCVPLDVSQQFEETDTQPTKADVTAKGQAFINSTSRRLLQTSIRVSYEPTASGIGERLINLCDTVRVVYPDLAVSSISKVVETRFNVLTERYDELTIGTIRNNIVDTIAGLISGGATYSGGGSGSGGGGSAVGAVLYNMPQNLNEAQKAQARQNIGVTGSGGDVEVDIPFAMPEDYGAVGDGNTDDRAAIVAMFADVPDNAHCVFYGNYYISDGITITRPVNVTMYGKIVVAPTAEFGIRISGHDVRRNTFRLNLETSGTSGQWNKTDSTHKTIGIDLYASWENTFDINVRNFAVGIRLISTNYDCTYNKIFIRYIFDCKTAILLTGDETMTGGTTAQNTFYGGRTGCSRGTMSYLDETDPDDYYSPLTSILVGSRTNNNNNFISCSFECGFEKNVENYENRAIIVANIYYCAFVGCRYEGITTFRSRPLCCVVSGFGFNELDYTGVDLGENGKYSKGAGTVIGVNKPQISSYVNPLKIQRGGSQGANMVEYYNSNGYLVGAVTSPGDVVAPSFRLTNAMRVLTNTGMSETVGIRDISVPKKGSYVESDYLIDSSFTWLTTDTWGLSDKGFLVFKGKNGAVSVFQPIIVGEPSVARTGQMAFIDGSPMWYDGTNWIAASNSVLIDISDDGSMLYNGDSITTSEVAALVADGKVVTGRFDSQGDGSELLLLSLRTGEEQGKIEFNGISDDGTNKYLISAKEQSGDVLFISREPLRFTENYAVSLNADGTVNTKDSKLQWSVVSSRLANKNYADYLLVTWGNSLFTAKADEKLTTANGDVKFICDCEHDGIQRHMIFTLTSANALQTTLIETYARVPITVWEVADVTQGLIALNTNVSSSLAWQLTGLNLAPFKRIKIYSRAGRKTGSLSADSSITPASIIEMSLDDRAKETVSQNVFIGSSVVQNPNDPNRLGILTCAVSSDKTKFAVVRATTLYGTAATSNTDAYPCVFKIEGYYD